LFKTLILRLK